MNEYDDLVLEIWVHPLSRNAGPNDPYKPVIIILSNDGGCGSEDDHVLVREDYLHSV
jgi:hypothetical protein